MNRVRAAAAGARARAALFALLAAAVVWRLLGVDVFPVTLNDTVAYLLHARDLPAGGLVEQGYRLIGYPGYLAACRGMAAPLPLDALFLAAAIQRALLAAAALGALAAFGWAGAPLAFALSSTPLLALANLLIPEGLLVPLGALFGTLVARLALAEARAGDTAGGAAQLAAAGGYALACLLFAALFALKPQYALFGLLLAAAAARLWTRAPRTRALVAASLAATVLASGAFAVALALENQRELGELRPVSEGARAVWFGAHHAVFTVHPENRARPELRELWDDGPYGYLHALEAREADYARRSQLLQRRTAALFAAAHTSAWAERLRSFAGYWLGGRSDDVGRRLAQVANARALAIERVARANHFSARHGVEAFYREFNDGRVPLYAELRREPARWSLGYRRRQRLLGLLALGVLLGAARRPGSRGIALATLASLTLAGAGLALHFLDVWRYALPGFVIGGCVASGVAHQWLAQRRAACPGVRAGPEWSAAAG